MPDSITPDPIREALRRLVEAVHGYSPRENHDWRCEYRTAERGYVPGGPRVIDCECGFDDLGLAVRDATDALSAHSIPVGRTVTAETIHGSSMALCDGEQDENDRRNGIKPWCERFAASLAALPESPVPLDVDLGAAWREAEAALPEGWVIDGLARIYAAGTDANGSDVDAWSARAYYHGPRGGPVQVAVKETPAAALRALAARLASPTGEPET
jgi:hypothetical protein